MADRTFIQFRASLPVAVHAKRFDRRFYQPLRIGVGVAHRAFDFSRRVRFVGEQDFRGQDGCARACGVVFPRMAQSATLFRRVIHVDFVAHAANFVGRHRHHAIERFMARCAIETLLGMKCMVDENAGCTRFGFAAGHRHTRADENTRRHRATHPYPSFRFQNPLRPFQNLNVYPAFTRQ